MAIGNTKADVPISEAGFCARSICGEATHGGAARESIAMNPSSPIIEIHGDDVTVEASYLAVRLGLPVDRLRAEMRRGIIYSVVERGVGEDAGRLRLTFRYRARAWTVVVQRDGTLNEAPWSQG